MLCLCLYVPVLGQEQAEFEYFESKGLPAELKSIFRLSLFIPSQEFSTYRQWKQVRPRVSAAGGLEQPRVAARRGRSSLGLRSNSGARHGHVSCRGRGGWSSAGGLLGSFALNPVGAPCF